MCSTSNSFLVRVVWIPRILRTLPRFTTSTPVRHSWYFACLPRVWDWLGQHLSTKTREMRCNASSITLHSCELPHFSTNYCAHYCTQCYESRAELYVICNKQLRHVDPFPQDHAFNTVANYSETLRASITILCPLGKNTMTNCCVWCVSVSSHPSIDCIQYWAQCCTMFPALTVGLCRCSPGGMYH